MSHVVFIIVLCLGIVLGMIRFFKLCLGKEWRNALLQLILIVFAPLEMIFYTWNSSVYHQSEFTYLWRQLCQFDLYAFLVIGLFLLLLGFSLVPLNKRKKHVSLD